MKEVFETLNALNVNEHVERKNTGKASLAYLSWAWAWAEVKKKYPDASYEVVIPMTLKQGICAIRKLLLAG